MRNNVSAAARSTFRGNALAAFDRLPAPIRAALRETVVDWDPRVSRWELNKRIKAGMTEEQAVKVELAEIARADAHEIRCFGYCWPARFGRYPHIAAEATIARYDSARRRRRA